MGRNLYVGNLAFSVTDEQLADVFAEAGTVDSAHVIVDRDTGRSRGFAFVEMSSDEEAQQAINKFHGAELDGRELTVNEARPREPRRDGGGRSMGGGGGGGGFPPMGGDRGGGRRQDRRNNRRRSF